MTTNGWSDQSQEDSNYDSTWVVGSLKSTLTVKVNGWSKHSQKHSYHDHILTVYTCIKGSLATEFTYVGEDFYGARFLTNHQGGPEVF